jgi:hypothetical protein
MRRGSHGGAAIRRTLTLLFLVAAALAAAASPAQAGSGFLKGVWGPIKFPPGEAGCDGPQRCSAMPLYQQLGADVFEYQLQWNQIAPTRPANPRNPSDSAYKWPPEFTFAVNEAAARGMRVAFLIKGSPPWANGGKSWNWAPNTGDYADFVYAAARKFPSVRMWQIWGEPTRQNNFMPQGQEGAQLYARLLDASYFVLKGLNQNNIVIGGSTFFGGYTRPPLWIQYMRLPNGLPPHMDWYGHNPFEQRFPDISAGPIKEFRGLSDLDTLWREVKAAYSKRVRARIPKRCRTDRGFARSHRRYCLRLKCSRKRYRRSHPRRCFRKRWVYGTGHPTKLWLSEWSIQTDHGSYVFPYYVSRAEQVQYLKAAFALARSLPYVQGMGWYQLIDYPPSGNSPTWGLLEYDGDRKPVFGAYQQLP